MSDTKCPICGKTIQKSKPSSSTSPGLCPVCYSEKCQGEQALIGVAVPCGHWFCADCAIHQYSQNGDVAQNSADNNKDDKTKSLPALCMKQNCAESEVKQVLVMDHDEPKQLAKCVDHWWKDSFRDQSPWNQFSSGPLYYRWTLGRHLSHLQNLASERLKESTHKNLKTGELFDQEHFDQKHFEAHDKAQRHPEMVETQIDNETGGLDHSEDVLKDFVQLELKDLHKWNQDDKASTKSHESDK